MAIEDREWKQRTALSAALDAAYISSGDLWLKYFSLGGTVGEYEVDAYLQGMLSLPPLQRDLLAHAVNEMIDDMPPLPRATYTDDAAVDGESQDAGVERGRETGDGHRSEPPG